MVTNLSNNLVDIEQLHWCEKCCQAEMMTDTRDMYENLSQIDVTDSLVKIFSI